MSTQMGIFEVKTNLSQIIDKVEKGMEVVITKRGKPVAKLSPVEEEPEMTFKEAVEAMFEMRKLYRGKPGDDNIRDLINEGRKY
jgi:prevent-host-death family protein